MNDAQTGNITGHNTIASALTNIVTGKEDANFSSPNGKYNFFTCSSNTLKCDEYAFNASSILIAGNGEFNVKHYTGKFNAYQRTYVINPTTENVDIKYLYYCLGLSLKSLKSISQGTSTKFLTATIINNLPIKLPSIRSQKQIVSILSSLDNKIKLNRRINENLEQQAQALFKSWFVDNKNNKLQYYELGDITLITAGGDKPSVYSKDLTEQCRIPIYSNGTENEGLYGYTTSAKINSASITISARGTIGYVCLRTEPYVPIVRLISVVPNIENLSAEYLYLWALTQNINGTGTTQQQLTVPNFRHTLIGIPTKEKMIRFNNIVFPIFQRIVINKNENKILSQLRDTLLPRLMSGKLEIKDNSYD